MQRATVLVMACAFLAVCSTVVAIATIAYDLKNRKKGIVERDPNDWLFKGWEDLIFDALFGKSTSEKLCGVDRAEHERLCEIMHVRPYFKKMVATKALGAGILITCLAVVALTFNYDPVIAAVAGLIGAAAFVLMWVQPEAKLKNDAEERLFLIHNDLPRFLSLLEKAMDLPIDQAMMVTAKKFESPISDDLIDSINKVSLGANGWQETLMDLAKVYQIEDFSDLVLEIVNSYEQGANIRPLVNRKAYEVEQNRMYAVEAHDSKIKTLIYIPIIALKVLPLMALICIPMMNDIL